MIETWSHIRAAGMDDALLVEQLDTVRRHPWWQARARLVAKLLKGRGLTRGSSVLDAGCGWGVTLDALERGGFLTRGLDTSLQMLQTIDGPARRLILGDLTCALETDEQFDAVLALDVLEHIDDEHKALGNLGSRLHAHGFLVVSVPALPEMFGEFDEVQGHRRRYTPAMLRAVIERSGLAIERLFWWGAWLVPFLKRQRRRRLRKPGESDARVYARYLRVPSRARCLIAHAAFAIEHALAPAGFLPVGTSLFAVARHAPARRLANQLSHDSMMTSKSAS